MALEFSSMSQRNRWGLVGFACVVLIAVFYIYVWQPNQQELDSLQGEIATINLEIQRTRAIAQQLPDLEAALEQLEGRLEILSIILPDEQLTDRLLRDLQSVAADTGLQVTRFSPQDVILMDVYAEAPLQLDVTGTYHNLARFFDRVSRIGRVINVDEVSIQTVDDRPGATIEAQFTAKTFFFLEESQIQSETPAPGSQTQGTGNPTTARPQ